MSMGKHGLSATEIGAPYGLNGRVTNRLLEAMGVIEESEYGGWKFTELGEKYGKVIDRDNGYGGHARRDWPTTYYDESILDELKITPDLIAQARAVDVARRTERALKNAVDKEEAEAAFRAFQDQLAAENQAQNGQIDWVKVAAILGGIIVVVGGVVVVNKFGPDIKRKWTEVAAPRIDAARRRLTRSSPASSEGSDVPAEDESPEVSR